MRIGVVSGAFLPNVGGLEWKAHYLASLYVQRGHDVVVFAGRPWITFKQVPMPVTPTYKLVRCAQPVPGVERLNLAKHFYRQSILSEHRRRPFDLLHCHHIGPSTSYGLSVKAVTGLPVVATTCGSDVLSIPEIGFGERLQPRFDRQVRRNVHQVDVVGSISSAIREELEQLGTTARIVDIPNGVDWQTFQCGPSRVLRERLSLADDQLVVLSVGRNHPVKGYECGIRAFREVADRFKTAVYVLVGRGTSRLQPLVEQLALEGRVHLVEQVPAEELPAMYHSADLFFSPSLMEGFPQVAVQALACGLPCVLSDAPGNRDAGMGGGAMMARNADVGSMGACLAALLGDVDARRELGTKAYAASRRYAWERIADEYLSLFGQLIA